MEQQFLGKWVARTYRATHAYMAERLKKHHVGYGQFPFLNYLNRIGPSSQEEITQALFFDKGTTARAIKKLEEHGYVERNVADADRRRYEVRITEKGVAVAAEIRLILKDWNETLTAGFSKEQKAEAYKMMTMIASNAVCGVKNLQRAAANGGDR